MRKLAVIVPTLLALAATAAPTAASFPFVKSLAPPSEARGAVACVVLDAEVFERLDERMGNIRLVDENGRETPFCIRKLHVIQSFTREFKFQPETLSFTELPDNRFEVIFKRRPIQPEPAALEITTPLFNFEKVVTVQSGVDGRNWTTPAAPEKIYDYSRYLNVRKTRVSVPPGAGPYYRLEVSNVNEVHDSPLVEIITRSGRDPERSRTEASAFWRVPFRIDDLTLIQVEENVREDRPQRATNALTIESVVQDDAIRSTLAAAAAGGRPVLSLTLEVKDRNFSREVVVEGRASGETNSWRQVARGVIRSFEAGREKQRDITITLPSEQRFHAYRLVIHNGDNPPLDITGIAAEESVYGLQFFPRPGSAYTLLYGAKGVAAPNYDVATVLGAKPVEQMDSWRAGAALKNPDYKAVKGAPWKENAGRVIFVAAIALMSISLLIMIARVSRRIDKLGEPGGPPPKQG